MMGVNARVRKGLGFGIMALGIVMLFAVSAATPMFSGYDVYDYNADSSKGDDSSNGSDGTVQDDTSDGTDTDDSQVTPTGTCKNDCKDKCKKECKDKKEKKDKNLSVINGHVYDLKTGKPIAGAIVVLFPMNDRPVAPPEKPGQGERPPMPPMPPVGDEKPPVPPMPPVPPCGNEDGCYGDCKKGETPSGDCPQPPMPPVDDNERKVPCPDMNAIKVRTDKKGFFSARLHAGKYIMIVEAEGYMPFSDKVGIPSKTKFTHDVCLEKLPPKPKPDCIVEGRIIDAETGKGIAGAEVVIFNVPDMPEVPPDYTEIQKGRPENQDGTACGERKEDIKVMPFPIEERGMPVVVRTDENGCYKAPVFSGTVIVMASAPGYMMEQVRLDLPKETRTVIDLKLQREPRMLTLKIVWGYLGENNPEGTFRAWDGYVTVEGGAVKLMDTIQFESRGEYRNGGDDLVFEQEKRDTVSWRSSTTVARDGVVVAIMVKSMDPVTVTIKAGDWSLSVPLEKLIGMRQVFKVDDQGREVAVGCLPFECFEPRPGEEPREEPPVLPEPKETPERPQ